VAGGITLAGGLLGWSLAQGPPDPARRPVAAPPPLVRVVDVAPGPHRFRVRTHGTVAPRTESELVTEVSGRVVWTSPALAAGGFFEAGERLLEIDRRDYTNAVARARAQQERAASELELATVELERRQALAEREIASPPDLDRARNKARVAGATLSEARAALEQARLDLERTRILAPFAGRVHHKRVDVGQFVQRGTPAARVYAVDFAEVRLPVRDADLAFLDLSMDYREESGAAEGPEVLLRADFAGRRHLWRARVVRTEGEIDPATRMLHLVARVADPYARHDGRPALALGLFVEAEILGRVLTDALMVPRSAVHEGGRIWLVDTTDRLRVRSAEVLRNEGETAVLRALLAPGERLCLSNVARPVEGMPVRPVAEDGGSSDAALADRRS
jgi:RND family efflux transporter MFP subunit